MLDNRTLAYKCSLADIRSCAPCSAGYRQRGPACPGAYDHATTGHRLGILEAAAATTQVTNNIFNIKVLYELLNRFSHEILA